MPRSKASTAEEKVTRLKDQANRLDRQRADNHDAACRAMLAAREAGVNRSRLALLWKTSLSQVDRMVERARSKPTR